MQPALQQVQRPQSTRRYTSPHVHAWSQPCTHTPARARTVFSATHPNVLPILLQKFVCDGPSAAVLQDSHVTVVDPFHVVAAEEAIHRLHRARKSLSLDVYASCAWDV